MSRAPERVELLDPVDRWLHLAAVLGLLGALGSGPFLEAPGRLPAGSGGAAGMAALHGWCAAAALAGWAFHLVRVCLAWLEGRNPWGLVPRVADLRALVQALSWSLGLGRRGPEAARFSYRERLPYAVFLAVVPTLALSGWAVAHPARAAAIGPDGLVSAAALHGALGACCVPFLLWHVYFAHFQPAALFWNGAWLTGRAPWARVAAMRPDWARELEGGLLAEEQPLEQAASVESLLEAGNRAAREGRYGEAAAAYEEALQLYPGYSQALFNLGLVRARGGDRSGAAAALRSFLEQDPFNPVAGRARDLLRELGGAP